jgi:hypothetical protein
MLNKIKSFVKRVRQYLRVEMIFIEFDNMVDDS